VRSPHKKVHANCEYGASTWAECDKAADNVYADWQAMQQVLLAYRVALTGRRIRENNHFAQLVDIMLGHREVIVNKDGNPNEGQDVARLYAAIERVKAGDIPGYTLYTLPDVPAEQQEATLG
jgi:hypothetical protein